MTVTSIHDRSAVLRAMHRVSGESYHAYSDESLVRTLNRWASHLDEDVVRELARTQAIGAA